MFAFAFSGMLAFEIAFPIPRRSLLRWRALGLLRWRALGLLRWRAGLRLRLRLLFEKSLIF
jgi:hypothetical protein